MKLKPEFHFHVRLIDVETGAEEWRGTSIALLKANKTDDLVWELVGQLATAKAGASVLAGFFRIERLPKPRRNGGSDAGEPMTVAEVVALDAPKRTTRDNLSAPSTQVTSTKATKHQHTPVVQQHLALQTYRGMTKEVPDPQQRRIAATARTVQSLQESGVYTPGSNSLTRYGRRIERDFVREDPEVLAKKLRAYTRMQRAGNFDAAVAGAARPNPRRGAPRSNPRTEWAVRHPDASPGELAEFRSQHAYAADEGGHYELSPAVTRIPATVFRGVPRRHKAGAVRPNTASARNKASLREWVRRHPDADATDLSVLFELNASTGGEAIYAEHALELAVWDLGYEGLPHPTKNTPLSDLGRALGVDIRRDYADGQRCAKEDLAVGARNNNDAKMWSLDRLEKTLAAKEREEAAVWAALGRDKAAVLREWAADVPGFGYDTLSAIWDDAASCGVYADTPADALSRTYYEAGLSDEPSDRPVSMPRNLARYFGVDLDHAYAEGRKRRESGSR